MDALKLSYESELARRVDAARGPFTRHEFVRELIERELALFERPRRAVAQNAEDEAFEELENRLLGWRR